MTNNELIKLTEMSGFTPQYARNANFLFEKFAKLVEAKSKQSTEHVIIPIEPTDEMIAVYENRNDIYGTPQALHKALLLAVTNELNHDTN